MFRLNRIVLLFFLFMSLVNLYAQSIKVNVSKQECSVGESIQLSYTIEGSGNIELPKTPGFNRLGTSQSSQWINGASTMEITLTLRALNEGSFTFSPLILNSPKGRIESPTVSVRVSGSSNQSSNTKPYADSQRNQSNDDDLILEIQKNKNSVYVGEAFSLAANIYSQSPYVRFEDILFPDIHGGLVKELPDAADQSFKQTQYKGRNYFFATLKKWILLPQMSGRISIDPIVSKLILQKVVASNDPWENFFRGGKVEERKLNVSSLPTSIEVKAIPEKGKPDYYTNAVGQLEIQVSVDKTSVEVNDALVYVLKIKGNGNLPLVQFPIIEFSDAFEVSEPVIKEAYKFNQDGFSGSVQKEFILIAKRPGKVTLPVVYFSSFNPKTASFSEWKSDSVSIKIFGETSEIQTINSGKNTIGYKNLGEDIRYLWPYSYTTSEAQSDTLSKKPIFWFVWFLLLSIPLILLKFRSFIMLRSPNMEDVKYKKAINLARKKLFQAKKDLESGLSEKACKAVSSALCNYLQDRWKIPLAMQTNERLPQIMSEKGIGKQYIEYREIIGRCEKALYSPNAKEESESLYTLSVHWIANTEKLRK